MEWLLISLFLVLAILVNIRSFIGLSQLKEQREQMIEDKEAIHQSMEEFVANLEKENDELYHKLVNYIKVKESGLEEKIRLLESKLGTESTAVSSVSELVPVKKMVEAPIEIHEISAEQGHEKIAQLHKQGFSPKQIAKVLHMDRGEVELAVNLYEKKKSYQS
ncbi:DUF6115 domain-containing protein [Planococcus sp. YIM B11945]|uniref:DUF6115 domain-containing protein n=1 Tax=Planococcus sp. YIM B11945 TaxID=3435410 RepID=UPI003D7ED898